MGRKRSTVKTWVAAFRTHDKLFPLTKFPILKALTELGEKGPEQFQNEIEENIFKPRIGFKVGLQTEFISLDIPNAYLSLRNRLWHFS